jgi:hypothetical protein
VGFTFTLSPKWGCDNKYGDVDTDDIRMKLDAIKQEPKERVQKFFKHLDKLFQRGKIQDVE